MPVPMEEASRFGIVVTDEESKIKEFEEKPEKPSSNLASMGIYIFSWPVLKEALLKLSEQPNCDFGKHIIPYCHENGRRMFAYEYNGYWKDVGTLSSYWEANMELIDIIPEFNLYEEFWKIYTNSANIPPQYISDQSVVDRCIISNGSEIYGEVHNSVLGGGVTIGKGSIVRDSILMRDVVIGDNCVIDKAIIAEGTEIGNNVVIGIGSEVPNKEKPNIYSGGLATIGENSRIPSNVQIGKNTAISGYTVPEDYSDGVLAGGETLIKAGRVGFQMYHASGETSFIVCDVFVGDFFPCAGCRFFYFESIFGIFFSATVQPSNIRPSIDPVGRYFGFRWYDI